MAGPYSFETLSSQMDETQRTILHAIWQNFLEKQEWPLTRIIHHKFVKPTVISAVGRLGGTIICEVFDSGRYRYQLTFLGILLAVQGTAVEQMLVRYLEYLKVKFERDPALEGVTSQEVSIALNLSQENLTLLGMLLFMSPFHGGGSSSQEKWDAKFPRDVDDFPLQPDLREYLRAIVMKQYKPDVPINESGRMSFGQNEELESTKEREQKFKILLSSNQASLDFQSWSRELCLPQSHVAIIFADIDHFKAMNSRYTEATVDRTILPEVQRLLADLVRFHGEAYKYGGDEFVFILPNHNVAEALACAEKIRSCVEQHTFAVDGAPERLTVSGGVALSGQHGDTYEEVLQKANEAKRLAKIQRNTIKLAETGAGQNSLLPASGLSGNAQRLAVVLNQKSQHGLELDPILEASKLVEVLAISEDALGEAADELEERSWATLSRTSGMGRAGFSDISPTPLLFIETDLALKGWDPRSDAKVLANALIVGNERDGTWLRALDERLSWGPRRLNPAASYLVNHEYVEESKAVGADPYMSHYLRVTAKTRRFAKEA